jgi:hypothetical protein
VRYELRVQAGTLAASYVVWADGNVLVQSGTASGQLNVTGGVVQADLAKWLGVEPESLNNGFVGVNVQEIFGVPIAVTGTVNSITFASGETVAYVGSEVIANVSKIQGETINMGGNPGDGLLMTAGQTIGSSTLTAGQVRTELATELARIDVATSTRLASASYTAAPTAGTIADAVWDEARSGHTTNGTYGAVSEWAGANSLTASDVWTYATRTLTAYNWGGTGAYAITVNVKEGVTNISGATVSFTQGSDVYSATTNSSGNASFSLDAGTFTLAIFKAGYSFTPESVTVSALATLNKTITATSLPPAADPARKTIQITTKDGNGATQTAKSFYWRLTSPPTDDGFAYDYSTHTATTNGSGVFTDEWLIGGKYEYWRDDNKKVRRNVTIAADTDELPEV